MKVKTLSNREIHEICDELQDRSALSDKQKGMVLTLVITALRGKRLSRLWSRLAVWAGAQLPAADVVAKAKAIGLVVSSKKRRTRA